MQEEYIPYVSLHNHTHFSVLDALLDPGDLFKRAKELNQPAVAVTDHGTIAGAWDCLKASREYGVKLIIGFEGYFVDDVENKEARLRHIILLAKNAEGYKNLLILNKKGFENHIISYKKVYPRIDWKLLEQHKEGLICTTACGGGILGQLINLRNIDEAEIQAQKLKSIFGENLAIELQPNAMKRNSNLYGEYVDQNFTNRQLRKIAEKFDIKMIAATNAHYLNPTQHQAHDVFLSISSGQPITSNNRIRYNVNDFYVKSGDEVKSFFKRIWGEEFAEQLIKNTLYFADKCEEPNWIDPKFTNESGKELPQFPVKNQDDYDNFLKWKERHSDYKENEDILYLRYKCDLWLNNLSPENHTKYKERIDEELDVLEYHGFSSYMLIVADYIEFARKNNISVGPGRGSVGGSLVAYLLGIHAVDPIKYGLIFARFHNKQKSSYPDIDSDFSPAGRDRVKQYIINKYGSDNVAHVSNLITLKPKVYVRRISNAFQYGGDRKTAVDCGNIISDSISADVAKKNIQFALENAPLFVEYTKIYPELRKYAKDLDGKVIAWGTHAGGVLISKRPLTGLIPLRYDKDFNLAVEYEKERAEDNGLVKMDILGLEALDIIEKTYELIKQNGKEFSLKIPDYDKYDKNVYDLISKGDTFCVFQLGTSSGTIDLCKKIKPKNIEDLAIINTLARPAAREIRTDFIKTRNGELPIDISHPALERAYKPTYGFGIYEECLMYVAQDMAGWSLHQADNLRKLTKLKGKYPEKVAKWRQDFIDGAVKKETLNEEDAGKFWDNNIANFGGYAFNKSHAIFYSLLGYHTAYLKTYYPLEFLVANLMSEVNSNAKIAKDNILKIKEEIKNREIKILNPDINKSEMSYKIIDNHTLLTGLDALKYIGKDAIPEILKKRPFNTFDDFLTKVDSKKVKAPAIQALAASGCLDSISNGMTRKQMFLYAADFKRKLQTFLKNQKKNPEKHNKFEYPWPDVGEWNISGLYALEEKYLGEGVIGNKHLVYNNFFSVKPITFKLFPKILPELPNMTEEKARRYTKQVKNIEGVVKNYHEWKVKNEESKIFGQLMSKLLLEDIEGNKVVITFFPEKWEYFHHRISEIGGKNRKLEIGMGIKIIGTLQWYEGTVGVIFDELIDCCIPPQLPKDLEAKKVSMKIKSMKKAMEENTDRNEWLETIEDEISLTEYGDLEDDELFE